MLTTSQRRYDRGMTTKITVSLPDDAVAAAKRAVKEGRAASVSAYVADALEHAYGERPLAQLVAELLAEQPPSDEDREWVDRVLGML